MSTTVCLHFTSLSNAHSGSDTLTSILKMMRPRLKKVSMSSHISTARESMSDPGQTLSVRPIPTQHCRLLCAHCPSPPPCLPISRPSVHTHQSDTTAILPRALGIQESNLGISSCILPSISNSTSKTMNLFWRQRSEAFLLGDSQVYFLQNQTCGYQPSTIS